MFGMAASAMGFSVTAAQADVFDANADSYIESDSADANFGDDDRMRARTSDNFRQRNMYFRFDISGLSFDLADATEASISIFGVAGDPDPSNILGIYGVPDMAETWEEDTLTWANAPLKISSTPDAGDPNDISNDNPLSTFAIPESNNVGTGRYDVFAGEEFIFSNTIELVDFLKTDTNNSVTFVVQYATDNVGSTFNAGTLETSGVSPAQLVVIPEPSLATLLAGCVGSLLVLGRRRRI